MSGYSKLHFFFRGSALLCNVYPPTISAKGLDPLLLLKY